ncbi:MULTISPECIES: BTAD domain-containing putative transcriptional regulator [unclassified Nocardia]|uniref:BTAD domain-containing putative transcriptional regulator n=1 Tax=unclassified Nocardia TaxID=2637762 RepID=UPI001CE433DB|nr:MULTISPECIES: BTAD domain-containing putative transcriptional regulator [unclassified Nocardia]
MFGVLGAVLVMRSDGAVVAVGGPRVRALLAMLALEAGRTVGRDALIDGLYGVDVPADAGHALQSQVSRLRRVLRDHAVEVVAEGAGYRLAVDPDAVDAHRFARLAADGRRALAAGDATGAAALLDEALGLWRGPALADVRDMPFADVQVTRLTEAKLTAQEDRAAAAMALGEAGWVIDDFTEIVAAQPLRERARALLVRALAADGRQADALAVFEAGRELLATELGADPGPELAAAHLEVLRGESAAPARSRTLPAQLTEIIGRDDELSRLATAFGRTRLVTLTGPGGTGKTRLAIAAAEWSPGDVCFVDLTVVAADDQVVHAVATAAGVRAAAADIETRLTAALSGRALLLVLDNCEHIVAAVAALTHRLLTACPGLRVLATSREALGITGELLFPVGQLDVGGPDDDPDTAARRAAVALFAERASAAGPGFTLDSRTVAAVRRICAALDGLPLAIELAAARLRALSLDEIEARLTDRFRLLARGGRTAAPRHRTLRGVVEWSWELLDSAERTLARRLTVFAGGCTLADAEQICAVPDTDDLLTGLVEKSLVEATDGRYRMLETIREFGAEQLTASGERERFQRTHATHFARLAAVTDPLLRGADQLPALARLTAEHGNLLAALRWCADNDPELGGRLAPDLSWYLWLRGLRSAAAEPAARIAATLANSETGFPAAEYALCITMAAAGGAAGPAELAYAARALLAAKRPLRLPHAVLMLAMVAGSIVDPDGDPETQRDLFDTDPWSQGLLRLGTGLRHQYFGDEAAARAEFTTALAEFRTVGDRWGMASALDKLSAAAQRDGALAQSLALADEAIGLAEQLGTVEDSADLLIRRADARTAAGDFPAARADYERAGRAAHTVGSAEMFADAQRGLGDLARQLGEFDTARACYAAALTGCTADSIPAAEVRAKVASGMAALAANTAQSQGDS